MLPYRAIFIPQAWVKDNAVEVDSEGETEWTPAGIPSQLADKADRKPGEWVLDTDDLLKNDKNAPEWVKNWRGPFTIMLCREEV